MYTGWSGLRVMSINYKNDIYQVEAKGIIIVLRPRLGGVCFRNHSVMH